MAGKAEGAEESKGKGKGKGAAAGGKPDVVPAKGAGKANKPNTTSVADGTTGSLPPLPEAEFGKVMTRFPPEPSGYGWLAVGSFSVK